MPTVPTQPHIDSIPNVGNSLRRSPSPNPPVMGERVRGVSGNLTSPRIAFNPDEYPWYVKHIDGIATVGIIGMFLYTSGFFAHNPGENASPCVVLAPRVHTRRASCPSRAAEKPSHAR